ncbi:MAG: PQQ-binding-like beta-propeller repeat protein [Fimbriimonadaceae bacterium]
MKIKHFPIASALLVAPAVFAQPTTINPFPPTGGQSQWHTFHGDSQRTGYSPYVGPVQPQLKWMLDVGGPVVSSPVIGQNGMIVLGPVLQDGLKPSYDILGISPTGSVAWRVKTPFVDGEFQQIATPAIGPMGTVYVGTPEGAFYAIQPDGKISWKYSAENPVLQHAVVSPKGRIFVGIDGFLTAFSPGGQVLWRRSLGTPRLGGGPSLGRDGTVYAIYGEEGIGSKLKAFSQAGVELWSRDIDLYFWPLAPPTIGPDGTIYTAAQSIFAFNPDGSQKWISQPTFGMQNIGSIAVDRSNNLYYSAYVYLWKLNPSGTVVWQKTLTGDGFSLGGSYSSILVDRNGNLFTGLGTGKRWAIPYEKQFLVLNNAGAQIGSFPLPEISGMSAPALASDGTLYFGALDSKLYAIQP